MAAVIDDRFWTKVQGGDVTTCWLWTGAISRDGYGNFGVTIAPYRVKTSCAHRVAYELLIGPIPDGLQLDHLCRNRACVNPWHLDPVTQKVNLRRGAALITSCPAGHAYDDRNTYVSPQGRRKCRACAAARKRRSHDAPRLDLSPSVEPRRLPRSGRT